MKYAGKISLILAMAMIVTMLASSEGKTVQAASTTTLRVTYDQTGARTMLASINEFRKSTRVWYWNSSTTKKLLASGLGDLEYDYALEKIAMIRAAEIAVSFSHIRPNGESCFTAGDDSDFIVRGENIASGYKSVGTVVAAWEEDKEDYSGQGHRRNMLGVLSDGSTDAFDAVGVAHIVYNGTHYWVQEFGTRKSASSTTYTTPNNYTDPVDGDKSVIVSLTASSGTTIEKSSATTATAAKKTAVSAVDIVAAPGNSFKLTWDNTGASKYIIYYKKSAWSSFKELATVSSKTTYTTDSLTNGTYEFKIKAGYTVSGKTTYSAYSPVFKTATIGIPYITGITKYSAGRVKVKFSTVKNVDGYQFIRSTAYNGTYVDYKAVVYKVSAYAIMKPVKNKTYYYKVRAYKEVDGVKIYGAWSPVAIYTLK